MMLYASILIQPEYSCSPGQGGSLVLFLKSSTRPTSVFAAKSQRSRRRSTYYHVLLRTNRNRATTPRKDLGGFSTANAVAGINTPLPSMGSRERNERVGWGGF